jgi:tRNA U34 5-methylaminomethyl-2-thiouridine-forming methyltransferase MnmC
MKPEFIYTADGSPTLFLPGMNEQYHSLNGAITESKYVFEEKGYTYHSAASPVVFEVGFGTGLNCLLTACNAQQLCRSTFYISIENNPLSTELIRRLNYGSLISKKAEALFHFIHECEWNVPVQISDYFKLLKLKADFVKNDWQLPASCDVVYFDAFGPDKQPEMWSAAVFARLYEVTSPGGVLVTYSAKGEVRRRLQASGFRTERLPGPPGKKEMLRGIKSG